MFFSRLHYRVEQTIQLVQLLRQDGNIARWRGICLLVLTDPTIHVGLAQGFTEFRSPHKAIDFLVCITRRRTLSSFGIQFVKTFKFFLLIGLPTLLSKKTLVKLHQIIYTEHSFNLV